MNQIGANTGEDLAFVAYDDERETTPTSRDSDGTASEDANEVEATDGDRFPAADFESKYFIFYFDFAEGQNTKISAKHEITDVL